MKYSTHFLSLENQIVNNHAIHCVLLKNRVPVLELYTEDLVTGTHIRYSIGIFELKHIINPYVINW